MQGRVWVATDAILQKPRPRLPSHVSVPRIRSHIWQRGHFYTIGVDSSIQPPPGMPSSCNLGGSDTMLSSCWDLKTYA